VDSIKSSYGQVVLVDNGGFFPESDPQMDAAWFLMDAMKMLNTAAVGTSERELRWGLAYLKSIVNQKNLPMVSSNLLEASTRRPVFKPYVIEKAGRAKVGIFSLMSDKVDLGPARDSLKVEEPSAAARRSIDELKKKGATVIVLLSQLGKVESEDLAAAVPGIDAVICGHNVPLLQKGRMVKNTVTSYGGEQGQYVSQTTITLDAKGKMTTGENESFILGPEIPDKPEITKVVKDFEDALNEKLRKAEKERAAEVQQQVTQQTDHFLGADLCQRCHQGETAQWKTTSHSMAWQTLIDVKKDATPECIGCHVVGYKAPGGFQGSTDAPRLVNVQCENCHGMGTRHEDYSSKLKVTAQTCTNCHHGENDPEFNWDKKLPMVAHGNMSGETVQRKKIKPTNPAMMKGGSGGQ
jgi:2',3'-cyclic-nucleotide 2'-phosphodiesterase (5'-nucleotidase family)